jgi:hypothetical protein
VTRAYAVCALALGVVLLGGCYGQVPPVKEPARLRVIAEPEEASVYINDRFAGRARHLEAQPKLMAPGVKYITVTAPRYFPHDVRLELPSGETELRIKLRAVPP